jgi:hypothetical protein
MIDKDTIEIATANYSVSNADYNSNYELTIEAAKKETQSNVNIAMHSILGKIQDRLESMHRLRPELYSWIDKNAGWLPALGQLKKTMIACQGVNQANKVHKYLSKKGINCAISHYKIEADSSEIKRFKDEPECLVLIVVGRGVLGFNMPELENVIDMTGSANIDRIMQLLCRVNRVHPDVKQKLFIKVAPINKVDYMHAVMHAVCCMFDKEWFLKYNGKNFLDMPVPVKREKRINSGTTCGGHKPKKNKVEVIEFTGLPSIEFFKTLNHKRDDAFSGVEYTTIRDVRAQLFDLKISHSEERTLEIAKNYKGINFQKDYTSEYNHAWSNGYIDVLNAMLGKGKKKSFEEVKKENLEIIKNYDGPSLAREFPKVFKHSNRYGYLPKSNRVEKKKQINIKLSYEYTGDCFWRDYPSQLAHAIKHKYVSELKNGIKKN